MDLKSTENLCREQLSSAERVNIIKLSYESYFQQSLEDMRSVENLGFAIDDESTKFANSIALIKADYKKSIEDGNQTEKIEHTFTTTIKNWFIKVWSFIAGIFTKIAAIVVNMIKAVILYIQKKRLAKNAMYTKLYGIFDKLYDDENTKIIMDTLVDSKAKIHSFNLINDSNNAHDTANFSEVSAALNNVDLKNFLRNNAVIISNSNSIFNIPALDEFLKTEVLSGEDNNEKMNVLENAIYNLTSQAVLSGEVSPDHKKIDPTIARFSDMINAGKIKEVANMLTYRTATVNRETIDTCEFIGISNMVDAKRTINKILVAYNRDAELVLGRGGYIDVLNEILKRYKTVASNDSKHIAAINNVIKKQLSILTGKNEQEQKIENNIKRFTKMMLKVKNVKTNFVAFRQHLIGNILTMFNMEDQCIRQMVAAINIKEMRDAGKTANDDDLKEFDVSYFIGNHDKTDEYIDDNDEEEIVYPEGFGFDDESNESLDGSNKKQKKLTEEEQLEKEENERKDKIADATVKGFSKIRDVLDKKTKKPSIGNALG